MTNNLENCSYLINALIQGGVTAFFIAPGSRSTPLVLALEGIDVEIYTHFDERALGFMALGYAKKRAKKAAIIVTSGSAVGNLLPAVMEAFHEEVPLILLTADRPFELQDTMANQTTKQMGIFSSFVSWEKELTFSENIEKGSIHSFASYAVKEPGPVHINIQFREPLYSNEKTISPNRAISYTEGSLEIKESSLPLSSDQKGLILIGETDEDLSHVIAFAEENNLSIFADLLSQDRTYPTSSAIVRSYAHLIDHFPQPDYVLHFGGRFISKKLFKWLQKRPPEVYAHISSSLKHYDPYFLVNHRMRCSFSSFVQALKISPQKENPYKSSPFLSYIDPEVDLLKKVMKIAPDNCSYFFANSMQARFADLYFYPEKAPYSIHANRGLSGIDGNIATSIGICLREKRPLIAFIGDLAALHDMGSFAFLKKEALPILFCIVNNFGGKIFSHLPISEKKELFAKYFRHHHNHEFSQIAKAFSLTYKTLHPHEEIGQKELSLKSPMILEYLVPERDSSCLATSIMEKESFPL